MAEESQTPAVEAEDRPEDNLPKNTVAVEDTGKLKKKVTVTVPRERIDAKRDEMFGELSNTAQVPGFRVGRAPRRLIEKRFGKEVGQDVRNALVGESIGSAIEDAKLKTLGEPQIDLEKVELPDDGDLSFSFDVEIEPEFELPPLEGIGLTREIFEVTPERIDEYVQNIRENQARYEKVDSSANEGDAVLTSVKITGEDISWENPRVPLRVAAGVIEGLPIVNLDKELSGKKAGDVVTIRTQAAESHPTEAWRGKDLEIQLTIHEVQRRNLPEVNEDFAVSRGFDSLKAMREYLGDRLKTRVQQEIQKSLRDQICEYLLEKTSFDLPDGVVNRQTLRTLQRRYVDLLQMGVPREKIEENLAHLQAAAVEQAQRDLRLSFVLGKIAEQEKIETDDAEINSRVAQMAQQYNRRPERLRQELAADGSLEQVGEAIREEKVLDKLLERAKIADKTPEEIKAEKKAAAKKVEHKAEKKAPEKSEKAEAKPKAEAKKAKEEKAEKPSEKKPSKPPAKKAASKPAESKPPKKKKK